MNEANMSFDFPTADELKSIFAVFAKKIVIPQSSSQLVTHVPTNALANVNGEGKFVRDARFQYRAAFGWGHYHQSKSPSDSYHREIKRLREMGYMKQSRAQ
jgi:hypothetical protein